MLKEVPLTLRVRGMTQRTRGKKPAGKAMQMHTPPTNTPSFRLATGSIENATHFRQPAH